MEEDIAKKDLLNKKKLIDRQRKQKFYYDRTARDLNPLNVNDNVFVRKVLKKELEPATITKICNRPRSYEIKLNNGNLIERNRRHIYKGPNDSNEILDEQHNDKMIEANVESPVQNVNNDESSKTSENPVSIQMTRSGRVIKQPNRFQDYITK